MVPLEPPDQDHTPELGWPDDITMAPAPVEGQTLSGSGNTTFGAAEALASHVGGFATVPPYWDGAEITGVAGSVVTMATPAGSPDGPQVATVVATADDQEVFSLPGAPDVALIQSIKRTAAIPTDIAPDADNPSHNLAAGVVAIGNPDPNPILNGDSLDFTYLNSFAGPVPSGVDFAIVPPKDPPALGFSVGDAWSAAYRVFIEGGQAMGQSPIPMSLAGAEAAMKGVIDGLMGPPGLGAIAIQAGAAAFWGVVAGSAASIFPGALAAVPPPSLVGMSAAVLAAGASTLAIPIPDPWDDSASKAAAGLFAGAIFGTSQGGLVIFQPGPSPVPFPFA